MQHKFNLNFQRILNSEGKPVSEIQLFKQGEFEHWSGEKFNVNNDFIELMIDNFKALIANSKDNKIIPIDYNHASLNYNAEDAKAAGWVLDLFTKEDGLYAKVEWTTKAKEYIENGEYRYISPEFGLDVTDEYGKEIQGPALFAAALTNRPFLKGMDALSLSIKNNKNKKESSNVKLTELVNTLGLSDKATESDVLEAIKAQQETVKEISETLKCGEQEINDQLKSVLKAKEANETELTKLSSKVETIQKEAKEQRFVKMFDDAVKEGKVAVAEKEGLQELFALSEEAVRKNIEARPKGSLFSVKGSPQGGSEDNENDLTFENAIQKEITENKITWNEAYNKVKAAMPKLAAKHAGTTN